MKRFLTTLLIALMVSVNACAATDYKFENNGGTADPVTLKIFTTGTGWTDSWQATKDEFTIVTESTFLKKMDISPELTITNSTGIGEAALTLRVPADHNAQVNFQNLTTNFWSLVGDVTNTNTQGPFRLWNGVLSATALQVEPDNTFTIFGPLEQSTTVGTLNSFITTNDALQTAFQTGNGTATSPFNYLIFKHKVLSDGNTHPTNDWQVGMQGSSTDFTFQYSPSSPDFFLNPDPALVLNGSGAMTHLLTVKDNSGNANVAMLEVKDSSDVVKAKIDNEGDATLNTVVATASLNAAISGTSGDTTGAGVGVKGAATGSGGTGVYGESTSGASGFFKSSSNGNTASTVVIHDSSQATDRKMLDIRNGSTTTVASIDKEGDAIFNSVNTSALPTMVTTNTTQTITAAKTFSAATTLFSVNASALPNMVGANGSTGGTKGAVPAPAAADNVKYLRGDGTWQTVSSTPANMMTTDSFQIASQGKQFQGLVKSNSLRVGASAPAPSTTVYSKDTFTDTNGVQLTSHTPDVGPAWSVSGDASQFTVQGNQMSRSGNVIRHAFLNSGQTDVTVTLDVTHLENLTAILVRRTDVANYWELFYDFGNGGWQMSLVNGGPDTFYGPILGGTTGQVTLTARGNVITATSPNGDTFSVTSTVHNTATGVGFILDGFSGNASTIDNWLVTSPINTDGVVYAQKAEVNGIVDANEMYITPPAGSEAALTLKVASDNNNSQINFGRDTAGTFSNYWSLVADDVDGEQGPLRVWNAAVSETAVTIFGNNNVDFAGNINAVDGAFATAVINGGSSSIPALDVIGSSGIGATSIRAQSAASGGAAVRGISTGGSSSSYGGRFDSSVGSSIFAQSSSSGNTSPTLVVRDASSAQAADTAMIAVRDAAGSTTVASIDKEGDAVLNNVTSTGQIVSEKHTVTFSATPTFDYANSNTQEITLTANVTSSTFSNGVSGGLYLLILKQDATGSRTVTWPASVKWTGATPPTLSGANKVDVCRFIYDGTSYYGACNLNF